MGTKMISVEPYYLYDPKEELSIKIDKNLSSFRKQRKMFHQKLKSQSTLQKFNKQQKNHYEKNPAIRSTIFTKDNISSDALLPFINTAMKLQQEAYEAAVATNRGYELQLVLIFLEAFISIVFNFYYMISVLVQPSAFKLSRSDTIAYLAQHLIEPSVCIAVIVIAFSMLKYQFTKSQQIINKIIIHSEDNEVRARFLAFSQQVQSNIPQFSVYGFFQLDGSVIFSMISATTTYLIILVQALGGENQVDPIFSDLQSETHQNSTY